MDHFKKYITLGGLEEMMNYIAYCLYNVGSSTSHNLIGLYGLLQGYLYFTLLYFTSSILFYLHSYPYFISLCRYLGTVWLKTGVVV
jgi:hypothetical protein